MISQVKEKLSKRRGRPLNVVYMGSPDFAVPGLLALSQMPEVELVGVASNPDKRRGRGSTTSPTPVKKTALELDLPIFDVGKTQDLAFHEWLINLKPDLLVVVAFRILPEAVLRIPAIGSINVHGSLLPKYRGAAPIHHAIMQGETETGLTTFFLNEQMDAGQIILQKQTQISENETTGEVYHRLMQMSGPFLQHTIRSILSDDLSLTEQNEQDACPAPKLFDEHCRIDWSKDANELHNQIRGLSPFPGAYTESTEGVRYNLLKSSIYTGESFTEWSAERVGSILKTSTNQAIVCCGDGFIVLEEVKASGKKAMSGWDALNGKADLCFRVKPLSGN